MPLWGQKSKFWAPPQSESRAIPGEPGGTHLSGNSAHQIEVKNLISARDFYLPGEKNKFRGQKPDFASGLLFTRGKKTNFQVKSLKIPETAKSAKLEIGGGAGASAERSNLRKSTKSMKSQQKVNKGA